MKKEYKVEYEYVVGGVPQKATIPLIIRDSMEISSFVEHLCEDEDKQIVSLKMVKVRDIND
jgi:hypothetical protein